MAHRNGASWQSWEGRKAVDGVRMGGALASPRTRPTHKVPRQCRGWWTEVLAHVWAIEGMRLILMDAGVVLDPTASSVAPAPESS